MTAIASFRSGHECAPKRPASASPDPVFYRVDLQIRRFFAGFPQDGGTTQAAPRSARSSKEHERPPQPGNQVSPADLGDSIPKEGQ